jgi:hypothetical protein
MSRAAPARRTVESLKDFGDEDEKNDHEAREKLPDRERRTDRDRHGEFHRHPSCAERLEGLLQDRIHPDERSDDSDDTDLREGLPDAEPHGGAGDSDKRDPRDVHRFEMMILGMARNSLDGTRFGAGNVRRLVRGCECHRARFRNDHVFLFHAVSLAEVGFHDIQELLRSHGAFGVGVFPWVDEMSADVAFDHFGHEAVNCSAAGGDELKRAGAFLLVRQCAVDRLDLTTDAAHPVSEFPFALNGVRHCST